MTAALDPRWTELVGRRAAELPAGAGTVGDAMITDPKTHPASTTVAEARAFFDDDHVHALLVVDADAVLVAVVERADLDAAADAAADAAPAWVLGRRDGRVVGPGTDLRDTWHHMTASHHRRLAVVDAAGTLRGLLCLKRARHGFCSDAGVRARAAAHH